MPEGPEIRRAADTLSEALRRRKLRVVKFGIERLEPWESRLRGRVVRKVEPRGKAILVALGDDLHLYSHNQLYGRWIVTGPDATPDTTRRLRVELRNSRASALLYSASDVEVLRREELETHPYLRKLGPDPLAPGVTAKRLGERSREDAFARRSLGGLLLDPAFFAGIGNYLRSEILFAARLRPERRPADLDRREVSALARATSTLVRRSYRTGGLTADAALVRRRRARGPARSGYRHFVFGREGEDCPNCGASIARITFTGRRLYLCEACQR